MQKLPVALAAIVLVAAGVAASFLVFGNTDPAPESPSAPSVAPTPVAPAPPVELAKITTPVESDDTAAGRQEVDVEEAAAEVDEFEPLPTWAPEESRFVDVTVDLPPNAPADPTLVVLALDGPKDWGALHGRRGIVAERLRLGRDTSYKGLLAVAAVDSSGRARIAFPPDAETPHIALSGRYLYTDASLAVSLERGSLAIQPDFGAWVTGHLIAPSGTAGTWTEEIEVRLQTDLEALTSLDGRRRIGYQQDRMPGDGYEFLAVPVGQSFTIGYESDELAHAYTEGFTAAPGEHVVHDIRLVVGGRLTGRVTDGDGRPVAGAEIAAMAREFYGSLVFGVRKTETDVEGTYTLDAVRPGDVWLKVDHDAYLDTRTEAAIQVKDGGVHMAPDIKLARGGVIAGVVSFADGMPAVGAKVSLAPDLSGNPQGIGIEESTFAGADTEQEVGEDGRFELGGLGPGPFVLLAETKVADDAERTAGRWSARLRSIAPVESDKEDLFVVLDAPVQLSGVVVDTEEQPVAAFEIVAERAASQWYLPPSERESKDFESADGAFTVTDLSRGKWTVRAKSTGYILAEPLEVELPTDEELRLQLHRPIHIAGKVIDADGKPVAGANVGPELDLNQSVALQQGREVDVPKTTSDSSGAFLLEGLTPGRGTIHASKDGWARSAGFAYQLDANQGVSDAVLALRRGATITGEVRGEDGEGLASSQVHIQLTGTITGRRSTTTDAKGRFEVHRLEPGRWQVTAFESDGDGAYDYSAMLSTLKMSMVELVDEGEAHVILGAVPENPVVVRGDITSDGSPVPGGIISFVPAEGGGLEAMKIESVKKDGSYKVTLRQPGEYLVTLQQDVSGGTQNSLEHRRLIPDEDEYRLDFELPSGRISGRVIGPNGDPLARARVTLNVADGAEYGTLFGGHYSETTTDDDGRYDLKNLRPGAYRVAAGGSILGGMFGEKATGGRTVARIDVREGQWVRGVDFRLDAPGGIRGVAVDHSGNPVEGAVVFVRDDGGNLMEVFSLTTSDTGGNFTYEGLAPGEYTIAARHDDLASAESERVRVESGKRASVRVVMDPGTLLLVSLQDKSGELVPAVISVVDGLGREMNGMIALENLMTMFSEGVEKTEQRVGPLPPGTYTVSAVSDGRNAKKVVTLTGQDNRKVTLRLK